jgi:3-deoxy-D-manno-octulosonic acid kinase
MAPEGFDLVDGGALRILARRGFADAVAAATEAGARGAARGRVRFADVGGERVAVRHYFRGGFLGRFVTDLYTSPERAFREVALYERARRAGVPTLEPLGAAARRAGPFWRLDLVTRAVEGARDLGALAAEERWPRSPRWRGAVLRAAARSVRALHEAGIEHADLNLKNILVVEAEREAPRALVIDLDRATERDPLVGGYAGGNLVRLYRSAAKLAHARGERPSRRDALRFLFAYGRREQAEVRALLRRVGRNRLRIGAHRLFWLRGGVPAAPPEGGG